MSDSDSENAIRKARNNGNGDNAKVTSSRIQRMRYWTNYEELRLVELWRRHIGEIPNYDKTLPVHRVIAEGMKERRLNLNAQECRRRINGMRNKYIAECKRLKLLKNTTGEKSDWYLFPYIDSIFNPRVRNCDFNHEENTLQRLHDTINALRPTLRKFTPYHGYKRVQYSHDPDTFPFLPQKLLYKNSNQEVTEPRAPLQVHTQNSQKPPVATTTTTTNPTHSYCILELPVPLTMEHIENLRLENDILSNQVDNELKMLQYKEAEVKEIQKGFEILEKSGKVDLNYLQCLMSTAMGMDKKSAI